jgi:hypothetical protein
MWILDCIVLNGTPLGWLPVLLRKPMAPPGGAKPGDLPVQFLGQRTNRHRHRHTYS